MISHCLAPSFETAIDLFQIEILESIQEDGDEGAIKAIFEAFRDDAAALFGKLARAVSAVELPIIVEVAHTLKGSGSTFGMVGFSEVACALEHAARAGASAQISKLSEALSAAYADSVGQLKEYFGRR